MKYAIQFIDDGGDYDEMSWEIHIDTAIKQLGMSVSNIVKLGGVILKPQSKSECNIVDTFRSKALLYGYIETDVPIPQWKKSNNGTMNLRGNPDRFIEMIDLWFYTFPITDDRIEVVLDIDGYYDHLCGEVE